MNPDRDEMVEKGGLVEDRFGDLFRVIDVTDEEVFMQKIKPKPSKDTVLTRTVRWENFKKDGYELVFP